MAVIDPTQLTSGSLFNIASEGGSKTYMLDTSGQYGPAGAKVAIPYYQDTAGKNVQTVESGSWLSSTLPGVYSPYKNPNIKAVTAQEPGGAKIEVFQDTRTGQLYSDAGGTQPGNWPAYKVIGGANTSYSAALNDSTTPRLTTGNVLGGDVVAGSRQTISGDQALAQQQAARDAFNQETARYAAMGPASTYVTSAQNQALLNQYNQRPPAPPQQLSQAGQVQIASYPAATAQQISQAPKMNIPFIEGLTTAQRTSITNLLSRLATSGGTLNATDAANYAYATGQKNPQQFVGKTYNDLKVGLGTPTGVIPSSISAGAMGGATLNVPTGTENISPDSFMSGIMAAIQAAVPAQATQDAITTKLLETQQKLLGKADAQRTAEAAQGLPQKQQQLQELNMQMAQLKGEFDQQNELVRNQPISMPAIVGQQAELQRSTAIRLGALATVQTALQGNIALAQQIADKTVALEFSKVEQEINNLKTAYELNKDTLNAQEKKKADALNIALKLREEQVSAAKEEKKNILDIAINAAKNGADNATLNKINSATTALDAVKAAGDYMTSGKKDYAAGTIGEYQFYAEQEKAAGRTPMDFNTYQTMDANRKAAAEKAQMAGLDPTIAKIGIDYGAKFDTSPIVKQYNETMNKKLGVDALLASGSTGPGDVALIYDFMKALDPTSVVRESEYTMGANSGNIFLGALAKFNGYFKETGGKIPENVRKEFQNIINQRFGAISTQYSNLKSETARKMQSLGISDPTLFLTSYEKAVNDPLNVVNNSSANDPLGLGFNTSGSVDTSAQSIANAIKQVESGGNYNAKGGSGEFGAYQFMPSTWRQWAQEFLGNANAPMTPANQDIVAQKKITSLLQQGYGPREIALIWNGGTPVVKAGVNKYGVKYDSGAYANKVLGTLNRIS